MDKQFQKLTDINEKKEICLPNKENINDHRCEKRNMVDVTL